MSSLFTFFSKAAAAAVRNFPPTLHNMWDFACQVLKKLPTTSPFALPNQHSASSSGTSSCRRCSNLHNNCGCMTPAQHAAAPNDNTTSVPVATKKRSRSMSEALTLSMYREKIPEDHPAKKRSRLSVHWVLSSSVLGTSARDALFGKKFNSRALGPTRPPSIIEGIKLRRKDDLRHAIQRKARILHAQHKAQFVKRNLEYAEMCRLRLAPPRKQFNDPRLNEPKRYFKPMYANRGRKCFLVLGFLEDGFLGPESVVRPRRIS